MSLIHINAPAKINLGLDVIRRRGDGYHEVKMIMQTIHLYDKISIQQTRGSGILLKTNFGFLPVNENNLVFKAARMLMDEFKIRTRLLIQLEKHIPVAAGMAGGSSDAAATLIALNKLLHLGLKRKHLMERGIQLGADVPYCILKGTALSEGIGEKLTPLPPVPDCHVLIAKPNIYVSTKFVYEHLILNSNTKHPDISGMIQDIQNGDILSISNKMENVLESVTAFKYPQISVLKQIMLEYGALGSLMSGSGPTVFGLFQDLTAAENAFYACKANDPDNHVFLTKLYKSDRDYNSKGR